MKDGVPWLRLNSGRWSYQSRVCAWHGQLIG
jgi:hypothetical protein